MFRCTLCASPCILGYVQGTGDLWRLGRRPALDGVRGMAILLVLACHMSVPGLTGAGAVGVTVFFVLSGFLITGLLVEERQRTGRISLRRFYVRRARRLLPALIASTLAVAASGAFLGAWWFEWRDLPPVLLYFGNWIEAGPSDLGGLGGTWSLAIEEQFYLLWPLLLIPIARKGPRVVMLLAGVGAALSLLVRIQLIAGGASSDRVYYGTDAVALALLLGAAVVSWRLTRCEGRAPTLTAWVGVALVGWPCTWTALSAAYLALPVAGLGAALLIFGVTGERRSRFLESRALVWFGQRSYGLYLWHCPIGILLRVHLGWSWPVLVAVMLPLSLLLAEVSYRWVEQPFRSRGRELDARRVRAEPTAGVVRFDPVSRLDSHS